MLGPGKYDEECSKLRNEVKGEIAVIVLGGNKGSGFSVQMSLLTLHLLPKILREIADDIECDSKKLAK
jgi:hypothetical protein